MSEGAKNTFQGVSGLCLVGALAALTALSIPATLAFTGMAVASYKLGESYDGIAGPS